MKFDISNIQTQSLDEAQKDFIFNAILKQKGFTFCRYNNVFYKWNFCFYKKVIDVYDDIRNEKETHEMKIISLTNEIAEIIELYEDYTNKEYDVKIVSEFYTPCYG